MIKLFDTTWLAALVALGARVFNDGSPIDRLEGRLVDLNQAAIDIQNRADAEERDLTDEETDEIEQILADFKRTEKDIERRRLMAKQTEQLTEPAPRQTQPRNSGQVPAGGRQYRQPVDPKAKGRHGFDNFGQFARSIVAAADIRRTGSGEMDPRLIQNAPTTVSTEGSGADGGFAVPPQFSSDIRKLVEAEDSLMSRCDQINITGNSMSFPKDETTPWQSSGGIQAYWEGEARQLDQSKLALESDASRLKKLTCLVPITDELLDDSTGLDSYLRSKAPEKIEFKVADAIINGNGAGKPLGVMNSDALVTVAKESGQTADTIVFANISKMWSRMYAPCRRSAIWLINQDIESQLDVLAFEGTSSSVPIYIPSGGLSSSPYSTLKGRPVVPHQVAQTLGDKGDISLIDLNKYRLLKKTVGIEASTSIHLWFDFDVMAFKFIMRVDGSPWHNSAITPKNGSATLSPFVTLAARA
ncbi:MAG: phage major capsid protein [Pontiella sp.]|nr:phage major capsid protein [Pontiella sp.]